MKRTTVIFLMLFFPVSFLLNAQKVSTSIDIGNRDFNPATLLWYETPATAWEEALPVGNGRLGAMVFGKYGEERIQLNEETYWSGGPYSTVVEGGAEVLPDIQKYLFEGEPIKAHKLFGRYMMGYPVEQQKYQSLANLHLFFKNQEEVSDYKRWLNLETGITCVEYTVGGITYRREIVSSEPDQVILVRLTASKPGSISFRAQLRGCRNQAHSNYATDYFRMDGVDQDGLLVHGKSADYLGVEGALRYKAQLKAIPEGGTMEVNDIDLIVKNADAVTLAIVAATNFVNYKDVSGDSDARVASYLNQIEGKFSKEMFASAVKDYQTFFKRVSLDLPKTDNSFLPTDQRMTGFANHADPNLASLCYNFARYVLISTSREGTEAANLQGIWNEDMNPSWDSKYTTNINTEMNYWPAEVMNLSDCHDPLFNLIDECVESGRITARNHYDCDGWVLHHNTDLWRGTAPINNSNHGIWVSGSGWLSSHLWEHYLFTLDEDFLRERAYPIMREAALFYSQYLVPDPKTGWLISTPSNSPENGGLVAGPTMDHQIIRSLFKSCVEASIILDTDKDFSSMLQEMIPRIAPNQIGRLGQLQEWMEDVDDPENKHRHVSHLWGMHPGNDINWKDSPELMEAARKSLLLRGDEGTGWSLAWKI
ncbi:MAG: glycoside hydrolase family 95 protein, partial [Bacteroidales bacterium]|nr:glycoside hydrolase family 95 protein [Bacteroidales bacterium]